MNTQINAQETNFSGLKLPGFLMLFLNTLVLIIIIGLFIWVAIDDTLSYTGIVAIIIIDAILFILNILGWAGFFQNEPNEARVMIFFGKYRGTVKDNGFFWVNPLLTKNKITLRARNLDAEPIKVNDRTGNPILIGMIVVWKVVDTYKASFDIDTTAHSSSVPVSGKAVIKEKMDAFEGFVQIQSDAALRYVAGMYPYDHTASNDDDSELTLRSGGNEMNEILENQINERLQIAGIEVVEARINYIAYAPEIAAVMLRRQQANAIIAAREKIVEGAVGMVKMALDKLSKDGIIELDDDKKAAMVSNLMVVLCGESNAQPIINSGTLYQ